MSCDIWQCLTLADPNPTFNRNALCALLESRIAILRIPRSAIPLRLSDLRDDIYLRRTMAESTKYANGSLTNFGPYLAKHVSNPRLYFERARRIYEVLGNNFGLDYAVRVALCRHFRLKSFEPAVDARHGPYAP